jgi:hypothetical protein
MTFASPTNVVIVVVCMAASYVLSQTTTTMAFTTTTTTIRTIYIPSTGSTRLYSTSINNNHDDDEISNASINTVTSSRRDMMIQTIGTVTAVLPSLLLFQSPLPASAAVTGVKKVNSKLSSFGLPGVTDIPDGYVPILEIYGKGKNRNPLLVTFNHPLSWVVTLPSNNINGEDGTIQVGDYGKGDTASLFVDDTVISSSSNEISRTMIDEGLRKCISQRGSNMYQNFKLLNVNPGPGPYIDGQSYQIAEFKYQLLTGAGFEVDRKGIASFTLTGTTTKSNDKTMEIFWAASVDARYKKTAETLRNIVTSFRCFADGLNFAEEVIA